MFAALPGNRGAVRAVFSEEARRREALPGSAENRAVCEGGLTGAGAADAGELRRIPLNARSDLRFWGYLHHVSFP
ncbi:hypothetical protein Sfulv_24940 [Streptomyces fulvorobeus]|uniref:Uncharacterized protein n=1 Tax=Streptomyces fulvorobeus TaxID=284028 RepID=A0A7J0C6X5_9ACTN|nr:hypothetical protein [Streptomyces fulvorobeus]GFM97683.1 hypothetical protein Sfulv_24940 [Streptomyces fulvorobeus]